MDNVIHKYTLVASNNYSNFNDKLLATT